MDKLLDLMPRLMTSKPVEVVKILQTMLRQSTFLHLPLPEQVRPRLLRQSKLCTLVIFFDQLGTQATTFPSLAPTCPPANQEMEWGTDHVLLPRDDLALESLCFLLAYRSTKLQPPSSSQQASQTTLCGLHLGWLWPWTSMQPWNMCRIRRTL